MSARRMSGVGRSPSFVEADLEVEGTANREKASRISSSCAAVRLFSLASLEARGLGLVVVAVVVEEEDAAALRLLD